MPKKFVIIDGNSLIHRGYHAIPNLTTSEGKPTGAVFGFTTIFLKVIAELEPDYLAVTFDSRPPTFRHKKFPEYKAQRPKMDELLVMQIPDVKKIVETLNCPKWELQGYEADDIIGTLVKKVRSNEQNFNIFIVTGDMDTLQLVDEHTKVYTSKRGLTDTIIYDPSTVRKRYGFGPESVIDYKALRGDPSDNIPGVAGIGEKTATELIQKFGTLEKIYEEYQDSDIKERTKMLLSEGKEKAFVSKDLVTLDLNVPIDFDLESCAFHENFNRQNLIDFLEELEFNSLVKKVPYPKTSSQTIPIDIAIANVKKSEGSYQLIDNEEKFESLLNELKKVKAFAFDTEINSLNIHTGELVGVSLCWEEKKAVYIAFNLPDQDMEKVREQRLAKLKTFFENPEIEKYGHNLKFDIMIVEKYGIKVKPISFDTMLAAYLLKPGSKVGLKNLAFQELGIEMTEIEELLGKGKKQITFDQVSLEQASDYSSADADMTFRLVKIFKEKLKKPLG